MEVKINILTASLDDLIAEYGKCIMRVYTDYGIHGENFRYALDCKVHPTAKIGKNVTLLTGVIIDKNAIIGNNVIVSDDAYIGEGCKISDGCVIGSRCHIRERSTVGARAMLNPDTRVNGKRIF